ncbi:MAG: ATP-binding protein [Desulforhopalus sp.]
MNIRRKDLIHERTNRGQKLSNHQSQMKSTELERIAEISKLKEKLVKEVHRRKRAEYERRQSEKMGAFGLLASEVAHDLNNILAGIVSYPELLLAKLDCSNELYQPMKEIHEAGKRAATVAADLLSIARDAAMDHSHCNLNNLVYEYFSSLEYQHLKSNSHGTTYRFNLEAERADILGSSVHVKNCLMNLITNAVESIGNAGIITVATYNSSELLEIEGVEKITESVVLSIHDNGPGITQKDQKHIFDPFYSTKPMEKSGSGLGLAIVLRNMKNHNGKVNVESDANGTCFKLLFPVPAV